MKWQQLFEEKNYRHNNSDVAKVYSEGSTSLHVDNHGIVEYCFGAENRHPFPALAKIKSLPSDWWKRYLDKNPIVKKVFGNTEDGARQHFIKYGYREGRNPYPSKTTSKPTHTIVEPVIPVTPIPTIPPPQSPTGEWKVEEVAVFRNGYKAIAANWLGDSWYVSTSDVYRRANNSWIYKDGKLLKHISGAETLADPIEATGCLYYASEHRKAVRICGSEVVDMPVGGSGQWAIATGLWDGEPLMFVNTKYGADRVFKDGSVAKSLKTGKTIWKIQGHGFVRDVCGHYMTVGWNNGRENLQHRSGGIWPSRILTITRAGHLYGGGDVRYGYNKGSDGNIYKWGIPRWTKVGSTGAKNVMVMKAEDKTVVAASVEPATLSVLESGKIKNIWKGPRGQGGRSFGACCDIKNGVIIAAFSYPDKTVHVIKASR